MSNHYFQEGKQTLWLSIPFIVNQLLQISVATVDSIMAGMHSELTLAAVAQGASLWTASQLVIIGLTMPVVPMIARAFAKRDYHQLRELFQQSVWFSLLLAVFGVVLVGASPLLLHGVGVEASIIPPATDYLQVMALGMPFFVLYLPIRYLNEGIANPKSIMFITAASIPINIIGNYVLIDGWWIFPAMGASGIAVSSVCSLVFVLIVGYGYIRRAKKVARLKLFADFSPLRRHFFIRQIHLGVPNAAALLLEAGMFACIVLLSGRLGVTTAAANQIAFSYISTTFMLPLGLSLAITTRIGMANHHGNSRQLRDIGVSGIALGGLLMCISVLIIVCFGESIARLYSDDEQVIQLAVGLLALATIFQIPDGIQVCGAGALRGLEETKAPMQYALLGYWILGVPIGVMLAFYIGMGGQGLWGGLIVGLTVTAVLVSRKFLRLTRDLCNEQKNV